MAKGESRPCSTGESEFESARQLIFHRALYFYTERRDASRNSATGIPPGFPGIRNRRWRSSRAREAAHQSRAGFGEVEKHIDRLSVSRCLMYRNLADIEGVVSIGFFRRNLCVLDILIPCGVQSRELHRFSDNRAKPINHSSGADRSVR